MLDERSSNTTSVVVLCTAPDEATAQDLAAKVLAEKLAPARPRSPALPLSITGKVSWSKNTKCR